MELLKDKEECIGKYASKRKATEVARQEERATGRKHHAFFTHYHCPYDHVDKSCWTILLTQGKKA